ncbi:efflux RND transporter permease subunit [Candidatus Fermentibacteria bacterium]|nr:efflux RND transporter permease subunit [Candidatus Fermentibacteria bacterium]
MIETVLRRPRGTAVIYLALLVLAVISFTRIPIEGTPDTQLPRLNVYTAWPGAGPEAVCEEVTRPVEDAARQVEGVEEVSSTSEAGSSNVTVSFEKGTDMDVAAMELAERISFMREDLPPGALPSSISAVLPEEMESEDFLVFALSGGDAQEMKRLAEDELVPAMERLYGVGGVTVQGLGDEEIVVDVSPQALRENGLTLAEVAQSLDAGIVDRNTGVVTDTAGTDAVLRVTTVPDGTDDLERMIVAVRGDRFVTLGDIARSVSVQYSENTLTVFRFNGLDQVTIQVDRVPGSNAIQVADRVMHRVEQMRERLPAGVSLDLVEDGTEKIREDLKALSWRALASLGAIFAVLLLMNPGLRAILLILSSILFSAALAVTAVYIAGYTVNMLTLSALAVAFGLLVDAAVVVMEAIAFRRRNGAGAVEAAGRGAREVALPILGGILTTLVAFVPLIASEGILRLYYRPFAFTMAATLAASYAVSLTLVPSIAGRWGNGAWFRERRWDAPLANAAARLHHRPWIPTSIILLLIGGSVWVFLAKIEKGRNWGFDFERDAIVVWMEFPPGTPQEVVDGAARGFEEILAGRDGIESMRTFVTGETAYLRATCEPSALESGAALGLEAEVFAHASTIGGIQGIYAGGISPEGYWRSTNSAGMVQTLELRGYDYEGLRNIARSIQVLLERHPRIAEVNIDWNRMTADRSQLGAAFERQELADLGINPAQLLAAVRYSLPGGFGGQIQLGDRRLDLGFRLDGQRNPLLSDVTEGRIRTASGGTVRLGDLLRLDTLSVQGSIMRENGEYSRTIAYTFMGAERMSARFRRTLLSSLVLPPGFRVYQDTTWVPRWLREEDRSTDLNLLVALAVMAVFAVTAILYESFTAPLWVLAVIPMAMIGVVAGFWISGQVFTPQAYVGSVFLVGIAVNNSILLVDCFLRHRRSGTATREALDMAVRERLRPVMQTSLTTIAGLLPLVLWPVAGSDDLWSTLSFTVISGMATSTLLVLVALPSLIQLTTRRGQAE